MGLGGLCTADSPTFTPPVRSPLCVGDWTSDPLWLFIPQPWGLTGSQIFQHLETVIISLFSLHFLKPQFSLAKVIR